MNRLKKGPEIKLSELHMPQVLVDLYYDLKDRHLLPVVALLLVGIVAVPLLLGGSSGSEEPAPGASASAAPATARTSSLVVTKEAAPLRDYKRRLDHLTEKDPFVQQYVQDEGAEGEGGGESGSGEVTIPGGEEEAPPPESEGGPPVTTSPGEGEITYYTYAMDVRVVPVSVDGKPSKAEPSVRRDLPPLTMLPSRSTPALTYLGTTKDGQKALMLVSSDVTAVFGDSPCAVGSETCQLLALKIGEPETIVFGANSRIYRIELLKLELERTDGLNRASLGNDSDGPRPHPRGESPAPAG